MRDKTRRQRYDAKKKTAKTFPISVATVNFKHDGNIGYLIRSAACFGADRIHVIGSLPKRKILNPLSGSLVDYIPIEQHENPLEFLESVSAPNISVARKLFIEQHNWKPRENVKLILKNPVGI